MALFSNSPVMMGVLGLHVSRVGKITTHLIRPGEHKQVCAWLNHKFTDYQHFQQRGDNLLLALNDRRYLLYLACIVSDLLKSESLKN